VKSPLVVAKSPFMMVKYGEITIFDGIITIYACEIIYFYSKKSEKSQAPHSVGELPHGALFGSHEARAAQLQGQAGQGIRLQAPGACAVTKVLGCHGPWPWPWPWERMSFASHWIGLRENLQETMVLPSNIGLSG